MGISNLAAIAAGLVWLAQAGATPPTHLLWHLQPAEGASPEQTAQAERAIRAFFGKRQSDRLMDGLATDSLLQVQGNEEYIRCGTGTACLVGLGKLAKVRYVIAGEVAIRAGRTLTKLLLIDCLRGNRIMESEVESSGPPGTDQLLELETAMFDPERYVGSIELTTTVQGATVLLDGAKVGITPLPGPLAKLSAGKHELEVTKPGHQPFERSLRVPVGKTLHVVAILHPAAYLKIEPPTPFYLDWPFWTAAGAGVAGLLAGGLLHRDALVLDENADKLERAHLAGADAERDKASTRMLSAYIFYGVGGAGLVTAAVFAILDLASGTEPEQGSDSASPDIQIAPGPDSATIRASWRF
ncbi:MAG: PEGA domain-containing protein [Deltaproteobacteria bacterium]|nr:PEGA domain-containing protein [Deltaproteobacteria bacterium]